MGIQNAYTIFDIYYEPKLLTIAENYLNIDVRSTNCCWYYNHKYKTNMGALRLNYRKKKNQSLQEESTHKELTNNIHISLNYAIFTPLRQNIIEFRNYGYFIPSFVFDPLNVRSNDRFKNGYEHLKRDIENFDESFKTLNKMIEDYNHDLKEFETTGLENLITRYFEEHSFKVECYSKKQPSKNTVGCYLNFLEY